MNEADFKRTIWDFYDHSGRRSMPWRLNTEPYCVFVSEIMLQQTQVDRVIPKFEVFIAAFPSIQDLADASLQDVMRLWLGLGYNRRARYLHEAARIIEREHDGTIPHDSAALIALPGIGPNTAAAIQAYAFNMPVVFIETNIRSVYLHHFFPNKHKVADNELLPIIEKTLDQDRPRQWYWALMDYGTHLKKVKPNPSRASKHHTTQSKFEGSHRQLRGRVLNLLVLGPKSKKELQAELNDDRLDVVLGELNKDGLIDQTGNLLQIRAS